MLRKNLIQWVNALREFPKQSVLVIGDLMLDLYVQGPPRSVSQEAPVVIIRAKEKYYKLGGAANVAENIRALGGKVFLCGVIGDHNRHDDYGRSFLKTLQKSKLAAEGVLIDHSRPTTLKMRVLSQGQQIVRVDEEQTHRISKSLERQLQHFIRKTIPKVTAILISDYNKGVITPAIMRQVFHQARKRKIPVLVDPKPQNIRMYRGAYFVTPNEIEVSMVYGQYEVEEKRTPALAKKLQKDFGIANVLLTRGPRGMTLVSERGSTHSFPALASKVVDVSGAGDTVVAVMSMGVRLLDPMALTYLASVAAKCSVEKQGTATVSLQELRDGIQA
jgi:D-glycero-beta-D-manno-heptose-7-phosphate kinase